MVLVCLSVSQTQTIGTIKREKSDRGKVVKSVGWAKKMEKGLGVKTYSTSSLCTYWDEDTWREGGDR